MNKRICTAVTAIAAAMLLTASTVGIGTSATASGDHGSSDQSVLASKPPGCC